MTSTAQPVHESGTFKIGKRTVHRLGFGAMRLTGPGIWGEPDDREECVRVLHRALELGVDLIDTADSYGPYVSEQLIHDALHPYPKDLFIATKAGLVRGGPDQWDPVGRPEYLRQEAEMSLRRLGVDQLDLLQLHRPDPQVPLADQVGLLKELQDEGKVAEIGLSNVTVDQIEEAQQTARIVTVQNMYNLGKRQSSAVLDYCAAAGIGFIPWRPIDAGDAGDPDGPLTRIAKSMAATASQVALAWLLARSPVVLPIPGTAQVSHLEENMRAATLQLSEDEVDELDHAT